MTRGGMQRVTRMLATPSVGEKMTNVTLSLIFVNEHAYFRIAEQSRRGAWHSGQYGSYPSPRGRIQYVGCLGSLGYRFTATTCLLPAICFPLKRGRQLPYDPVRFPCAVSMEQRLRTAEHNVACPVNWSMAMPYECL